MPEFDNEGRGAIFRNDKKTSDRHPDYKGSLTIEGRKYWLSSWLQTSKAGVKYMSISAQPADEQPRDDKRDYQKPADNRGSSSHSNGGGARRQQPAHTPDDDEIPFGPEFR